jgi:hypothetical protein
VRSRPGGGQPYLHALDNRFQPGVPPPTTLGAPWGRGCPLPPQKHGRSCRTSSTLQHHSPGGSSDCDLQLHCRLAHVDPWLGQFGTGATGATTRRHDTATTPTRRRRWQTPALRACHPEGAEARPRCYDTTTTIRRLRRPAVGNTWDGWGSMPVVFPP